MVQNKDVVENLGFVCEKEVRIDARPEIVFEFFTDPNKMVQWMGVAADLDAREGGVFSVDVLPVALARGEYVRVEPPKYVSFTFGWEPGSGIPVAPGASLVEVTLRSDGDTTLVSLRHTGLPSEDSAQRHGGAWSHYMDRLVIVATGGDPGPDPSLQNTSE